MIVIHDNINSLHFSNDSGDLIVGIGDHLYKMSHLSCKSIKKKGFRCLFSLKDLPKAILFKTVSMQFNPTIPEVKESEEIDNAQLVRMSSADLIRLKRAHKAEQMFVDKCCSSLFIHFC